MTVNRLLEEFEELEEHSTDESDSDFFQYCACCGNELHYGNAYSEFARLVQQIDNNPDDDGLIATVIDSVPLTYICYSCSSINFNTHRLRRQLTELLDLPAPEPFVTEPSSDLAQTPDPCDRCGCQINPGNATVGLDIMIAQYDKPEGEDDGLITPIYTEELFTFCAACGNRMSEERLREAVDRVLIKVERTEGDENDDSDADADDEDKYADDDAVKKFLANILPALQRANESDKELAKEPAKYDINEIKAGRAGFLWPVED